MAKYSEEFKLQVVNEYLNGHVGYHLLAKKYRPLHPSQIHRWVQAYKEFGIEGLMKKTKKQFYSVQYKLDILNFIKQTGASYQDTAIEFNLNDPTLIANWNRQFLKEGIEGLQEKTKGRPSMSKKSKSTVKKQEKSMSREAQLERENENPNQTWETLILETFEKHEGRYGYRRIHAELKAQGHKINHKKVQRIMNELNLKCEKFVRKSRYKSYKGTVGKVAKNRLNRHFNTPYALQKVVTDVTEFKCTDDEKLYLSPMMDLYNGEIIGFSMSKRPTLDFVMDSLKQALPVIQERATYRTTIHSDQGWHYQHNTWVKTLKQNKIFQSMSRKATCADNAAMENFFGLLKQEMYYGEQLISYEALQKKIEKYIDYYNNDRIKQKLAGMSPVKYRIHTSQLAA